MSEHVHFQKETGITFCAHCGDILDPGSPDQEPHGETCKRAKAIVESWTGGVCSQCSVDACGWCLDGLRANIMAAINEKEADNE